MRVTWFLARSMINVAKFIPGAAGLRCCNTCHGPRMRARVAWRLGGGVLHAAALARGIGINANRAAEGADD